MTSLNLTNLPNEVAHEVCFFVNAIDLARLSQTCWHFRNLIRQDDRLWKRMYLCIFDAPRHAPESWALAVQNLILAEKILKSKDFDLKRENTAFLGSQILPLLMSTNSPHPQANIKFLQPYFHHGSRKTTASTLLRQSSLFRRCGTPHDLPADSSFLRQLSSRLHVYSGLPLELRQSEVIDLKGSDYLHPHARSRVYDLRRYKEKLNFWGPFTNDGSGRIDWEKVQGIWLVLGYGLRMISERASGHILPAIGKVMGMGINGEDQMWEGLGTNSYRAMDAELKDEVAAAGSSQDAGATTRLALADDGVLPIEYFEEIFLNHPKEAAFQRQQAIYALQDPYGVTGTWIRVVNFLDYHDLFAFNFSDRGNLPDHVEREPVLTAEAFRLIELTLWVTNIDWNGEIPEWDQPRPRHQARGQGEEEIRDDEWETTDEESGAEASRETIPVGGMDAVTEENVAAATASSSGIATPRPSGREAERTGSTNADGLYHKPAHGSEMQEAAEGGGKSPEQVEENKTVKYPVITFEGRSRSLHLRWDPNANSHIRGSNTFYHIIGYVRASPSAPVPASELKFDEGTDLSHVYPSAATSSAPSTSPYGLAPEDDLVIRWTTQSIFQGEPRWKSEGVQIGGLKSARGILGNWFDKDYDRHGPAGPTGFWKLSDECIRYPKIARQRFEGDIGVADDDDSD